MEVIERTFRGSREEINEYFGGTSGDEIEPVKELPDVAKSSKEHECITALYHVPGKMQLWYDFQDRVDGSNSQKRNAMNDLRGKGVVEVFSYSSVRTICLMYKLTEVGERLAEKLGDHGEVEKNFESGFPDDVEDLRSDGGVVAQDSSDLSMVIPNFDHMVPPCVKARGRHSKYEALYAYANGAEKAGEVGEIINHETTAVNSLTTTLKREGAVTRESPHHNEKHSVHVTETGEEMLETAEDMRFESKVLIDVLKAIDNGCMSGSQIQEYVDEDMSKRQVEVAIDSLSYQSYINGGKYKLRKLTPKGKELVESEPDPVIDRLEYDSAKSISDIAETEENRIQVKNKLEDLCQTMDAVRTISGKFLRLGENEDVGLIKETLKAVCGGAETTGEVTEIVNRPPNRVSSYLQNLEDEGRVTADRSESIKRVKPTNKGLETVSEEFD